MPTVDRAIPPGQVIYQTARTPIPGNGHQGSCCTADGQGEMLWFTYHDGSIRCFATEGGAITLLLVNGSVTERSVVPTPALDTDGAQVGCTRAPDGGLYLSIIGRKTGNSLSYRAVWVDSSPLSDGSGPWVHYSTVQEDEVAPYGSAFDEGCRANAGEIVMNGSTWFLAGHSWRSDGTVPRWECDGMASTDGGLSWSKVTGLYNSFRPSEVVSRQFGLYRGEWTWSIGSNNPPIVRGSSDLLSWSGRSGVSGLGAVYDAYQVPLVGAGCALVEVNRHSPQYRSLVGFYGGEPLAAPSFASATMGGTYGIELVDLMWMSVLYGSKRWPWYADMSADANGDGPWCVSNSAGSVKGLVLPGGWHVGEHQIRIG